MSFPDAKEALIQKCHDNKLEAIGYKNDIGEALEMQEKDWRNVNICDEGNRTYVASKDHIVSIGRPKWFGITFRSRDIMREWPDKTSTPKAEITKDLPHFSSPIIVADDVIELNSGDIIKDAAFKLFCAEIKDKKTNRKEARIWCVSKNYNATWGDDFIIALPAKNKNERKRPVKNKAAIYA